MLRKTTLSILVIAIVTGALLGLLSCSQGGDTYLEIKTLSPSSYLIPADTLSCKSQLVAIVSPTTPASNDVTGKYFTVRGLKFTWNHAYNALNIALIRLRFDNDGLNGSFKCDISGDELSALKYSAAGVPWTASIPATGSYSNKTTVGMSCDLRCGGVTTKERSFKASGRIQVIGYMTEPDGNQIPVNVSTPFSIENLN